VAHLAQLVGKGMKVLGLPQRVMKQQHLSHGPSGVEPVVGKPARFAALSPLGPRSIGLPSAGAVEMASARLVWL
jgi:hypothetical protein